MGWWPGGAVLGDTPTQGPPLHQGHTSSKRGTGASWRLKEGGPITKRDIPAWPGLAIAKDGTYLPSSASLWQSIRHTSLASPQQGTGCPHHPNLATEKDKILWPSLTTVRDGVCQPSLTTAGIKWDGPAWPPSLGRHLLLGAGWVSFPFLLWGWGWGEGGLKGPFPGLFPPQSAPVYNVPWVLARYG